MQKSNNFNQKGDTNVKFDSGATILKTTNLVDFGSAEVARSGKGDWDSFEILGSSNKQESEYQSPEEETPAVKAALKRARRMSVGRKILTLTSLDLEMRKKKITA